MRLKIQNVCAARSFVPRSRTPPVYTLFAITKHKRTDMCTENTQRTPNTQSMASVPGRCIEREISKHTRPLAEPKRTSAQRRFSNSSFSFGKTNVVNYLVDWRPSQRVRCRACLMGTTHVRGVVKRFRLRDERSFTC